MTTATTDIPAGCVRVLFWRKTRDDSRDTASDVGEAIISAKGALQRCRDAEVSPDSEWRNAAGHGIQIVYASGRTRTVRAWE
jgi:hypothetical protein